jgi:large subunit ribosomal protein L18
MQDRIKHKLRQLRHWRIRKKVHGSKERPRMSVCFTNENIYVQFIDDIAGVTLASASTRGKGKASSKKAGANVETAKKLGTQAAQAAKSKGINEIVFDRSGFRYHGKVKALADAAREAGLKF